MNFIEIYGATLVASACLAALGALHKKTRLSSIGVLIAIGIYGLGIHIIQNFYMPAADKRSVGLGIQSINITPSNWLDMVDGRGSENILSKSSIAGIPGLLLPLGSGPLLKTAYCAEDDGLIVFETDRFGFRNKNELWDRREHDIVIIGDSFAEGACVKTTIPNLFGQQSYPVVVTIGKGGNGPLAAYATLREYIDVYHPKIIVNMITTNDYSRDARSQYEIDFTREISDSILSRYYNDDKFSQNYFSRGDLELYRDYASALYENYRVPFLQRVANYFGWPILKYLAYELVLNKQKNDHDEIRYLEDDHKAALKSVYAKLQSLADAEKAQLINIVLPDKTCLKNSNPQAWVTSLLESNGIPYVDLSFDLCKEPYFARFGGHFSEAGYQALARVLMNYLKN